MECPYTKKRLFVYSDDTAQLMRIVRTLPQFAWHRRNWELLRPFVMLDHADEVADLRSAGVFIAGITDKDALRANAADMCDVLVDMTERSIIVSPSAKDDMAVTKELHKEIAEYMVASAKDGTEQNLIKRILNRTSQLIERIKKLGGGDGKVDRSAITSRQNLSPNVKRFVLNLAQCEGFLA